MTTGRAKPRKGRPAKRGTATSASNGHGGAKADEASTIGRNPLDQLVPVGAVRQLTRRRRKPPIVDAPTLVASPGPGPAAKLAITVPQGLADQVQAILAVRTDLSFDQLMSSALAEVLRSLRQGSPPGGGRAGAEVKELSRELARRR
jgi:hypothetical protein